MPQREQEHSAGGDSRLDADMVVEDDRHLVASVEEVDPDRLSVDTHILDDEDPLNVS